MEVICRQAYARKYARKQEVKKAIKKLLLLRKNARIPIEDKPIELTKEIINIFDILLKVKELG